MKKYYSLSLKCLLLLSLVLIFSACNKQYVGKQFNTNYWSSVRPSVINTQTDQWFIWIYKIEKGSKENEYILTGTADPSTGSAKSFNRLDLVTSKFSLILADKNIVVDNIPFLLNGTDLSRPISFKKTFECESSFDKVRIFWSARVFG